MTGDRVTVLGAGAWGTALANVAARAGGPVTLVARDAGRARQIDEARQNARHLPGIALEPAVTVTAEARRAITAGAIVLLATPAQGLRAELGAVAEAVCPETPLVLASKGVERDRSTLLSTVVIETVPHAVPAVLSGPSFASDVARGLPTAVTLACADPAVRMRIAARMALPTFRLYASADVTGAEIGGAVKNVLAIACGAAEGLGLGESARAALTTRGFAEMARLGLALGAELDTLIGLSGLGDLVLTCGARQSRNYSLGKALGEGRTLETVMGERSSVTEGVHSAAAVVALARRHAVTMPIASAVEALVAGRTSVAEAVEALLSRPQRDEGIDGQTRRAALD